MKRHIARTAPLLLALTGVLVSALAQASITTGYRVLCAFVSLVEGGILVATPALIRDFAGTFDSYWADPAFVPYDPGDPADAERFRMALGYDRVVVTWWRTGLFQSSSSRSSAGLTRANSDRCSSRSAARTAS